jgi:hypothetical protein
MLLFILLIIKVKKAAQELGQPLFYPKYAFNSLFLEVCRRRRIAFSLICLTRSRVKLNFAPISSSVKP